MSAEEDLEANKTPLLEAPTRRKPEPASDIPSPDVEAAKTKSLEKSKQMHQDMCDKVFKPLMWLLFTGGILAICSLYCTSCLIGLCMVCICLCPFIPILNIPLWISIVLLMWRGWSLTNGHLSLVWE